MTSAEYFDRHGYTACVILAAGIPLPQADQQMPSKERQLNGVEEHYPACQ
jgi:hypothetical protein